MIAYRWIILVLGMLAYTTSYFARSNYTGIARFVSADLGLDKASLGVMGAAFFYAYAAGQLPWGVAADRWGSRRAVVIGIFLTAATIWGFSTSHTYGELKIWRALNGLAAAAVYVSMAGALSRWFPSKERGLSQSMFAGIGGAGGEIAANVLLPVLIVYAGSSWRGSTRLMAVMIAVIGAACLLFLRSAPAGMAATVRRPFDRAMLSDPRLWQFTALYSGMIIALRILPPWLPLFATDIYASRGMPLGQAVVAGGLLSTCYQAGRIVGVPAAGFLSDRLIRRGVRRETVVTVFLLATVGLLLVLFAGPSSTLLLAVVASIMGTTINTFPLVTTAVSEAFGEVRTSAAMGFVATWAQLCGATALAVSGYLGVALNPVPGNSLEEYRGIWLVGMAGCLLTAIAGISLSRAAGRICPQPEAALGRQV
jgi:MFS transporter, OPA family, sugar phosphate sensor protein UhpC